MRLFLSLTTAALLAACSSAPPAEPAAEKSAEPAPAAAQPFVFVSDPATKELMAMKVEIYAETLWNAGLDETTSPKKAADWKPLEDAANGLIESGKAMLVAPLAKDQGKWKEESEKLISMSETVLKAAKEKNLMALSDTANKMTEDSCSSCHKLYYTGP